MSLDLPITRIQHTGIPVTDLAASKAFYAGLVKHPKVLKVVALSGGYSRTEANERLRKNHGVVASFSRALVEGLSTRQSDEEFDAQLDSAIQDIYEASLIKMTTTRKE